MSLYRWVRAAPEIAKILSALDGARRGEQEAVEYLKNDALFDAAEVWREGGRPAARHAWEALRGVVRPDQPEYIDAEFRVLDTVRPPWEHFVNRLLRQPFGGHIITGPPGQGKTTLAKKLAQRIQAEQGYKVECVNMYGEDVPGFASIIGSDALVGRMRQLKLYLDSLADELDEDEDEAKKDKTPVAMPPQRRVIIIDEASLGLSSNPHDPARRAALQALAQCRHLSWVVLYIGQWLGQLPLALLAQTTVWVKQPDGREIQTDRDNPAVRDLWTRATEAFKSLRQSPWYVEPYNTPKAWAYCDCRSLNGQTGYTGLVPFTPPEQIETEVEDGPA